MPNRTFLVLFVAGCVVVFARRIRSEAPSGPLRAPMRVDVNHASASELESLPGVGRGLAARILATRDETSCGFRTVADLDDVPGVGPATLRRLAPLVRFERPASCE